MDYEKIKYQIGLVIPIYKDVKTQIFHAWEWIFLHEHCFFLLKEIFIVTSHGDNLRYKGNNADTHNNYLAQITLSATKETIFS